MTTGNTSTEGGPSPWSAEYNPWTLQEAVSEKKSIPALRECLDMTRAHMPENYEEISRGVFSDLVDLQLLPLITHMLDNGDMPVSSVWPHTIAHQWPSKDFIDALLARDWDINAQDGLFFSSPAEGGNRLLDYLVRASLGQEPLARWLVEEKGAKVDGLTAGVAPQRGRPPPPVLETCAQHGTVAMYRFLEAHGAEPSPRVLQVAAQAAASAGADPAAAVVPNDSDGPPMDKDGGAGARTAAMLRFLVEERGLDVNGIDDADVSHEPMYTHFGTPIAYAAGCPRGAAVVTWLLGKGADPRIKGPFYPEENAFDRARLGHADEVVAVLQAWEAARCPNVHDSKRPVN